MYCDEDVCGETYCITDGLNCQDKSLNSCNDKCRPKYGDRTKCYLCNFDDINYYYIDSSGVCRNSCAGSYIIDSSKECIEGTNNDLFLMGNIYYEECPINSRSNSPKNCICQNKYYIEEVGGGKKTYHCLNPNEICPIGYEYYNYVTNECYLGDDCNTETPIKKTEANGNIRCHTSCIGDEFYKKITITESTETREICLDSCDAHTYIDSITNKKYCVDNCKEFNDDLRKKNNYCVHKTQCDFYDDTNICLNSCEESLNNKFHNFDNNKCIASCNADSDNYYIYSRNYICYKEENCNFIQEVSSEKKCLSKCELEEGFKSLIPGEEKKCYRSCTETAYKYHNQGSNICIQKCSSSGNDKIYHKDGAFECYSSCKEIDDGTFIYMKIDESGDGVCYSSSPCTNTNDYYFKIKDNVKKCVSKEYCESINYKYIKDKECIEECNDYKGYDDTSTLIKCFGMSDCFSEEYKFYNADEKKCWKSIPYGYCIKNNDDPNKIEIIPLGNNYYYEESSLKYCLNSCHSKNKYIDFIDKKKCIDNCKIDDKFYYYDPRNYECLKTCIGSGLEFAYESTTNANPCRIDNDGKCYYENNKLIRDSCDLYKSPGSKICVLSCQSNEKILTDNSGIKQCVNRCPSTFPYLDENNDCKNNCNFINEEGDKCLNSCNEGQGFYILSSTPTPQNTVCYSNCPYGHNYHDINSNKCIEKCGLENSSNKYHIDGGIVCYSSCNDIPAGPNGKYLYEKGSNTADDPIICSDIIPTDCQFYYINGVIKKCVSDCSSYKFKKGKECTNECNGYKANYNGAINENICFDNINDCFSGDTNYKYYNINSKMCWNNQPSDYYIKAISDLKYEVVQDCGDLLKYETGTDPKKCITLEECINLGKYKNGDSCGDCNDFIYNSQCVSSCGTGTGHDYHNFGTNICISGCSGEYSYQKENDDNKVCYHSCNDIETSGTYNYLKGNICSNIECLYYRELDNNVKQCYESEEDCIKAGFEYIKGKQCIYENECSEYKVQNIRDSNGKIISLGKCYSNTADCKTNGYFFYNTDIKECWRLTCKYPFHIMEIGSNSYPIENEGNTCVITCPSGYKLSDNYCKNNCPNFLDDDLNECVSDCGEKFILNTNKCTSSCNLYFINNSGKKECLSQESTENCKTKSKFYFPDNPSKCLNECYKILDDGTIKFYFYNSDNKCLESCLDNTLPGNFNYADEPNTIHQQCKSTCGDKYYYENEKICREESCILFKESDSKICVSECGLTQKVDGNHCVDDCPSTDNPFFVEEKIEIKGIERPIKKCINQKCQDYSSEYGIIYVSSNGKECLKTCHEGFYKIGNYCYRNCEGSNKFIDPINYNCISSCSTDYYEKIPEYTDIYICKSNCDSRQFKVSDGNGKFECVSECPQEKNHINSENECKDNCGTQLKIIKDEKENYIIYQCIDLCPDNKFYSEENQRCYSICKGNDQNQFSLTIENDGEIIERKCHTSCIFEEIDTYKYYSEDKICMKECPLLVEQQTNRCTETCDNDYYKFKYESECLHECPDEKKRYLSSNYECIDICPEHKNYFPQSGFECIDECEENQYKEIILNSDNKPTGEFRCVSNYEDKKYYKNDRILRDACFSDHYVIQDTNECIENCDSITTNIYYYYEPDADDTSIHENTCVLSCREGKPFLEDNHCKTNCERKTKFKQGENICLENCPDNYYDKGGGECVNSCKDENLYLYKGNCVKYCPYEDNPKKFYIEPYNECLFDCTNQNPFFSEIIDEDEDGNEYKKYECYGDCTNYYIVNKNPNIIAKQCLPEEKTCETENLYANANNEKECYEVCPSDKYIDEDDKKCLNQCENYKYHEINSKLCLEPERCTSKIADFETKTCVTKCDKNYISEIKDGDTLKATICLNACNNEHNYGIYSDPDNKCINNCNTQFSEFSQLDSTNTKCVCKLLYYFDEEEKKTKCLDDSIAHCYDNENSSPYKIQLYGTYQCLKQCDQIPSLNGEFCYNTVEDACKDDLDIYSRLTIDVYGKRCDCPYKFYKDSNNKKHCLEEFSECTLTYSLYVPETKECVINCASTDSFKMQFKIFCLRTCPFGSTVTGSECICDNLWYASGSTYICLGPNDLCPENYPVYAPQTKQCLKKCKGSYYPYLFENKCYTGCEENIPNTEGITIYNNELTIKSCVCMRPWYYDAENNNEMHCPPLSDSINYCIDYHKNLNFMIHNTKQCVEKCPSNNPYFFNNECFESCENHAALEYNYVKSQETYECQCINLWYYEDSERTRKKCIDYINYKTCFKFDNAKPYLIYNTNECIDNCFPGMFVFNYTCYDKCPENTKELEEPEDGNTCTCDKDIITYWYEYIQDSKKFFVCDVKKCPINYDDNNHNRPNLLEEKKQCLLSCKDTDFPFSLRNICIEECPPYTKTNIEKCEFYELDDETKVTDKESLKNYANIQAKELYEKAVAYGGIHLGGYLFNKFEDVSLHIYAIDKENSLKEYSTKSNLTYIDLNTCLEKVYADASINVEDKIIVAKYDLKKNSNPTADQENSEENKKDKYLINQVEYEMFNSHTMERIDLSVCDPYEIIVSYPIFFNKNKYNNYDSGYNNNEYKKKFEIGKELNKKNKELDTFDFKNSLYKDLCIDIEINGKDLILKDRYEYLYPNGALLCESNCTYNNTDFDEERVNCKCTYKTDFDFNRVEEEKNDLVNDPNYYKPGQSSSNLEIIKCLSKLTAKKAIVNNEAFYYCTALTLVVSSMALVTGFYSLKVVPKNIKSLMEKIGSKMEFRNNNKISDKNDYNAISSARALNNPPKKSDNNNNQNDNKGNIIINKKINIDYNINNNISENDELDFNKNNHKNIKLDKNSKAEYIPPEYNFKYFKINDKGVIHKIERNKIPFDIKPDTKYLIERKEGKNYPEGYLNGPFLLDQNMIEIIDENNTITKYKKNSSNNNYINDIDKFNVNADKIIKRNIPRLNLNQNFNTDDNSLESKDKDVIKIRKILPSKNNKIIEDAHIETNQEKIRDNNEGLYTLIKREQTYLRLNYEKYSEKYHPNIFAIFLAEILDKVYFVKTCLFLKKFEIFTIYLSLYLFCHIILLSLICAFFTTESIKKIWEQANFPDMNYYLLYGFLSNIIVWIIYKIFICLLDIQDKVKELMKLNKNDTNNNDTENNIGNDDSNIIDSKLNEIMSTLKFRIIIFYIILFVFIILCAIYLVSFFAVYTGTKSYVLIGYLISIIEILLIKLIYGICLASLRIVSSENQKCLYKIVYILDKYVS